MINTPGMREVGVESAELAHTFSDIQAEASYSKLSSRQIEDEKITKMFGGKSAMHKRMKEAKDKNNRR